MGPGFFWLQRGQHTPASSSLAFCRSHSAIFIFHCTCTLQVEELERRLEAASSSSSHEQGELLTRLESESAEVGVRGCSGLVYLRGRVGGGAGSMCIVGSALEHTPCHRRGHLDGWWRVRASRAVVPAAAGLAGLATGEPA